MIVRQVQLEERSALDWRFSDRNPHHDRQTGQLRKRARRSTVRRAGWNLQVEQEAVTDFSGDERLGGRYGLRNPMESKHPSLHTTGHQEQHTVWATGPSWGRETAVTHGQPRCLADNQTGSLAAVSAVMGPQVRIWHARGQGLTSSQLHARSEPSSGPLGVGLDEPIPDSSGESSERDRGLLGHDQPLNMRRDPASAGDLR